METSAVFPSAPARRGLYESFYLRASSPAQPLGVWIRYTVHKRDGAAPRGSLWCTLFDARRPRPFQHKHTTARLSVPDGGWIAIDQAVLGPGGADGACGPASWSLRFTRQQGELRHLRPDWLYRAPLPRTKLTSPAPLARVSGSFQLAGEGAIELDQWPGMIGHNWGSEHAERWIWLHGAGFAEAPEAWLDVGLGRIRIAGRMSPWVANGALALDGRRHRLGGPGARGLHVAERPGGASIHLPGARGVALAAEIGAPSALTAGWRYADPDGGEHDVLNCSLAAVDLTLSLPGSAPRRLTSDHGGAYELGMRERDHGVPIAPFGDG
ncbi:MAG TPA: hypothetical protein VKG82_02945 [Solirubrobacteraceae bacterium]|nr:hypothetical protein [Solirubrobacteraceae bacterium]